MTENIQDMCRRYRARWEREGQWVEPDLDQALMFIVTEIGEACDARLRQSRFVRNNPGEAPDDLALGVELFDVVLMCCVVLDQLGLDLDILARIKLNAMNRKRRGDGRV